MSYIQQQVEGAKKLINAKGGTLTPLAQMYESKGYSSSPSTSSTGTTSSGPSVGDTLSQLQEELAQRQAELADALAAEEAKSSFAFSEQQGEPEMPTFDVEKEMELSYEQLLDLHQEEIDATNLVYDQLLNEARLEGQGRLGSQRAIAARGGLLGSDFGAAQKEKVLGFNEDIRRSIGAERTAAIGKIIGRVRDAAFRETEMKRLARNTSADEYIKYLSPQAKQDRKNQNIRAWASELMAAGYDIDDFTDDEWAEMLQGADVTKFEMAAAVEDLRREQAEEGGGGTGTVYSTSEGLVRVTPDGDAELIFGTGGSSTGSGITGYTRTQKLKLEGAGLLDAPREEQLEYLYGDKDDVTAGYNMISQFITDNPNASYEELYDGLQQIQHLHGLDDGQLKATLEARGYKKGQDNTQYTDKQFTDWATQIRKGFAAIGLSPEEELKKAIDYAQAGVLTSTGGKKIQLTPPQIRQLVEALNELGPRSRWQAVLPGGN